MNEVDDFNDDSDDGNWCGRRRRMRAVNFSDDALLMPGISYVANLLIKTRHDPTTVIIIGTIHRERKRERQTERDREHEERKSNLVMNENLHSHLCSKKDSKRCIALA